MKLVIAVHSEDFQASMAGKADDLRRALVLKVTKLSIDLQRSVKEDKLTGQVLHVRTGTLRRSINREVQERPDGVFAIVGTNVKYAAIHEFGGSILMLPRERITSFYVNADGSRKKGFAKSSEANYVMKHAARNFGTYITMPERSFLRSTFEEFKPRIKDELRATVMEVLR